MSVDGGLGWRKSQTRGYSPSCAALVLVAEIGYDFGVEFFPSFSSIFFQLAIFYLRLIASYFKEWIVTTAKIDTSFRLLVVLRAHFDSLFHNFIFVAFRRGRGAVHSRIFVSFTSEADFIKMFQSKTNWRGFEKGWCKARYCKSNNLELHLFW